MIQRYLQYNINFKASFVFFLLLFVNVVANANSLNKDDVSFPKKMLITNLQEQISGKITNIETGELIPFCNIEVKGSQAGTSSNELGEFILDVESLPVTLVFSHLNFEKRVVEVVNTSSLSVQLTPLVNSLDEVVLSANRKSKYPYELAEKAFSKTRKLTDKKNYGRAFYRQKSKNGDEYTEFSEIIYDTEFTVDGIDDWEILEGRYALKREKINNSNFTLLSRILKAIQPDTDDIIFPLSYNVKDYYEVKIIDMLSSENGDIAVLWFKPLPTVQIPAFEGEAYINTKTLDLLKINGTVVNDWLDFIKFREKKTYTKNYTLSYEMTFKKGQNDTVLIDYIKVDHSFDYYRNDSLVTHVTSTSNLTFFEYYNPDSTRRFKKSFRNQKSDWETLNKIGYNEIFWKDNPIVKRTPVEDEVIASFEKDNAFESIFLNTKEQIAFMQSNLRGDVFVEKLDATIRGYNNNNPVEKVFLHTDRDLFAAGETLWYKAYAVLGEYHRYSLASKELHVDLVDSDNKIVIFKTIKLDEGQGEGQIELPSNLQAGDYQLRAYTNWMRNFDNDFFFTKTIKLLNTNKAEDIQATNNDKIDLQFFPEGGHAVTGISGKITFKAIGSDGLGRKVKGYIKNSKGETIVAINSIYKGMGFFTLKPEFNETYIAILNDGSRYDLPEIKEKGYTMLIDNLNSRNIKVSIQASEELRSKPFYVIGLTNNNKQYQGKFKFNAESVLDFEIPKAKLPRGVLTLTLFDEQMRPWCERALFINNKKELTIEAELNKSDFKKRDKFELKVHINDAYGAPLSTNFSIAITDAKKVRKDKFGANILTHLLLQNDIKGHIENPGYYFNDDNRSTVAKLDLVMLTHGWRKFNWEELDKVDFSSSKEFPFKRGYTVSGIATDLQGEPLQNRELRMIAKSGDLLDLYVTKTSEDGSFVIENVTNQGNVEVAFNAYESDGDQIGTEVTLIGTMNEKIDLPKPNFKSQKGYVNNEMQSTNLLKKSTIPFFEYEDAEVLDEVLLKGKGKKGYTGEFKKYSESLYNVEPDYVIKNEDKTAGNILSHLGNIPGVAVDLSFNRVNFRGNRFGPLWILDGMRFDHEIDPRFEGGSRDEIEDSKTKTVGDSNSSTSNVPLMIQNLDFSSVERVEILKFGSETAIYGPSGRYGVIIIYTKNGKAKPNNAFSSKHTIQGYSQLKEFYSPKYDVALDVHKNPDNRSTLYWNPSVKTDKDGNATIIFYNSDTATSFEVDIQTLSEYGIPGVYLNTFKK